jgi:hypothetical protein
MFSLRDLAFFLAGVEFFHTVTHFVLGFYVGMPLDLKFMVLTYKTNNTAMIINGIITILLIWWGTRLHR